MILDNTEISKLKHSLAQFDDTLDIDVDTAYQRLKWSSGVNDTDTKQTIAGMLAVLVQFKNAPEPAIAAAQWRITQDIVDDQNRPGNLYYNAGYNALNE
jgi:hypothetical protein